MTVNAQELITAATFNGLQSRIETVLGQGFSDTGYGQTLSSSIVAANTVDLYRSFVFGELDEMASKKC